MKRIILIILIVVGILVCFILLKPKENIQLDNVVLKQEVNNKTMAMYVGKDNNYEEYNGNTFPKGYRLNIDKSKCVDKDGNEIENALYTKNNQVGVKSNKSFYCYLYFDEKENLSNICNGSTMQDCMNNNKSINTIANLNADQAGLYRYQGTRDMVDNNYICFGTSDKDECVHDTDYYMYRILGITNDGKLKLIKNTSVKEGNTITFPWHNTNQIKTIWGESDLFKRLNGTHTTMSNIFIGNNEYPYLKEDTWVNKIENSDWYQGFTRGGVVSGKTAYEVYQMENGKLDTQYTDFVNGSSKYVKEKFSLLSDAKIGLMNMTDYNYALQKDGYNCYGAGLNCSQNWLHNFGSINTREHITTAYGSDSDKSNYTRIEIYYNSSGGNGYIMDGSLDSRVRPVFFLTNKLNVTGVGSIDNPYIIK